MASRAQAIVMLQPTICTVQARFVEADAASVTLALYTAPLDVPPGTVACVHVAADRGIAFLASVVESTVEDGIPHLRLARPGEVAQMDHRRAFRVPIVEGRLAARLSLRTTTAEGHIGDLSRFGARVVLGSTSASIAVGQRLVLSIGAGASAVVVQARVVRRTPEGCGLAFTPGPDGAPLPALVALVEESERDWIRRQRVASPVEEG
ncbi:MAG: PilZ domain-containing protein [Myxococcota bacterium]